MSYTPLPSITLYFREGSSDKVYQCSIAHSGGDFYHVHFAYGRRGSTMTAGRKTASPVTLEQAQRVYDKVVNEKKSKGYVQGENGAPVHAPVSMLPGPTRKAERIATPAPAMAPMLLNRIEEAEAVKLLSDPAWGLQEKHDGTRLTVCVYGHDNSITGYNKLGKPVAIAQSIHDAVGFIAKPCVIDGEAVGDDYYVFDLLEHDGEDLRAMPYRIRLKWLSEILLNRDGDDLHESLHLVATYDHHAHKNLAFPSMKQRKAEGIVFKELDAPWSAGRPASGGAALKFKFEETASFIVDKVNGKRSVSLSLVQTGSLLRALVGNVTIPPNKSIPKPGAIVEVRYLYAFQGGSIFQPVYLGERDDVDHNECHTGQLKFKAA